ISIDLARRVGAGQESHFWHETAILGVETSILSDETAIFDGEVAIGAVRRLIPRRLPASVSPIRKFMAQCPPFSCRAPSAPRRPYLLPRNGKAQDRTRDHGPVRRGRRIVHFLPRGGAGSSRCSVFRGCEADDLP